MHVTLLVVVPAFIGLFWWQIQRVRQGNTLSWAYVFEWPFFTAYAVYMWWKLVHDQTIPVRQATPTGLSPEPTVPLQPTDTPGSTLPPASTVPPRPDRAGATAVPPRHDQSGPVPTATGEGGDPDDEELAAYNRYLAQLDASGRRKRW